MSNGLISNFAIVSLVFTLWLLAKNALVLAHRRTRAIGLGLLVGLGTVVVMTTAMHLSKGVILDLRFALIAGVMIIEGPFAGLIAAAIAGAFRMILGGAGAHAGLLAIAMSAAIGFTGWALRPARRPVWSAIYAGVFALCASAIPHLALFALPDTVRRSLNRELIAAEVALNFVAILIILYAMRYFKAKLRTNAMILEALRQAPDMVYVKDRQSRFVVANNAVIEHHRFARNTDIQGKTDYDLDPLRAPELFAEEQGLMGTRGAPVHRHETIALSADDTHVYDTVKTLIKDADSEVIGMVGITRDVTREWRSKRELAENQQLLSLILSTMSDGVALYDTDNRLLFCNEQYHRYFSLTRDVRVPGAKLEDILRVAAEREEQTSTPKTDIEGWIATTIANLRRGGTEEVQLFDGRTVEVRTRIIAERGVVSVVSDITQIRNAEQKLANLASQLQVLATTDALTAVMNRRAFDDEIENASARAKRTGEPLSLLIIDVDHFKAYNDLYGHPAGDECLKKVASTLAANLRRSTDTLARYGGEEFCIILPATNEDGARAVAEDMRRAIDAARILHEGSDLERLTISVGAATFTHIGGTATALALKQNADIALYAAKRRGRNRVQTHSDTLGEPLTAHG